MLLLTVAMMVGLLTANYNTITRYTLLYKEKRSLSTGTAEILFDKLSPKDEPPAPPRSAFLSLRLLRRKLSFQQSY